MLVWWVASDLSLHPPPSPPCLPPVSVHLRLSVVFPATQSAPPASVLGVASVKQDGTRNPCARLTRRRAYVHACSPAAQAGPELRGLQGRRPLRPGLRPGRGGAWPAGRAAGATATQAGRCPARFSGVGHGKANRQAVG